MAPRTSAPRHKLPLRPVQPFSLGLSQALGSAWNAVRPVTVVLARARIACLGPHLHPQPGALYVGKLAGLRPHRTRRGPLGEMVVKLSVSLHPDGHRSETRFRKLN